MSDTHGELYFARYDARNRPRQRRRRDRTGQQGGAAQLRVAQRLQRFVAEIGQVSFDYVWNG